jgi:hypothetical protein
MLPTALDRLISTGGHQSRQPYINIDAPPFRHWFIRKGLDIQFSHSVLLVHGLYPISNRKIELHLFQPEQLTKNQPTYIVNALISSADGILRGE